MATDSSSKLPQRDHNRESETDGVRADRPRDLQLPDRTRSRASSSRSSASSATASRIADPTTEALPPRPALDPIPPEVAEEFLRTFLRSGDEFLRVQPLLQLLLSAHAHKSERVEHEQVRKAKRRGGLRKDPIRQAVISRIAKLLRESDEIETTREVWDALRNGRRSLGGGMTMDFEPDLDGMSDKFDDSKRMIILSPTGPLKIVTYETFRSYVREARQSLHQPAR